MAGDAARLNALLILMLTVASVRAGTVDIRTQVAGETICSPESLQRFYERRGNTLAWSNGDHVSLDAAALVRAIEQSGDDGLTPGDYHLGALRRLLAQDAANRSDLDLLLTDAFLLLGAHLAGGRVNPVSIEPTWCLPPEKVDVAAVLDSALQNHNVEESIARLAPRDTAYVRLRSELTRLRRLESGGGWARVDDAKRADQIAVRLGVPLPPAPQQLDAKVREFQLLHGLEADGIVGPRTLHELNVAVADRVRQIELNMERWRWMPAALGDRYGVINIPEFRFRVLDRGREMLAMAVVVGKEFQRTPVFSSEITQVILSPDWNVPESIAWKELWPKARRNRRFLASEHIEVLAGGRLRQKPGPWNALGFLKFNLPNRFGVYLHDTPARHLFAENIRTFSHGCIRIEKPVDLAEYLLADDTAWPRQRIVEVSQSGITRTINVAAPLPIHVFYWTAFVDADEVLHFAPDVYHRDADLDHAMRKPPR
jgi:murein L,D-transpeptidase YcbB/YkuD